MIQLSELFPRKTQVPYHEDMPVADVANLDRHGKVLKAGPEASEIRFEGGGTAHSSIETVSDPQSPPYTSYQVRLQQRTRGLVQDEMDAIGFLATDLNIMTDDAGFNKKRHRADGGAARWLHFEGRPAFIAKSRFETPAKILCPKDFDVSRSLAPLFPKVAPGRRSAIPTETKQVNHE